MTGRRGCPPDIPYLWGGGRGSRYNGAMPTEEETLAALFAGKSIPEQKALLARLERAGAGLYRAWATVEADEQAKVALLAAAEREEDNARVLEG